MSKLKKKLKTQGKNSKLKTKTQFFGIFRILRCEKGVQKKACLKVSLKMSFLRGRKTLSLKFGKVTSEAY